MNLGKCLLSTVVVGFLVTFSASFLRTASFSRRPTLTLSNHHDDSSVPSFFRETPEPIVDRDEHVRILNDNLERHIGKGLRDFTKTTCDIAECWDDIHTNTRHALLSHGAINDLEGPVNNYGNFAALGAFETTWSQLTDLAASRLAKPGLDQEEWMQVLEKVRTMEKDGFLQNYKGFRCTMNQVSFFIRDALVWNCYDDEGEYYGQAILFDRDNSTFMDSPSWPPSEEI